MNEKQYESKISHFWMGLAVIVLIQAAFNMYLVKSLAEIDNDLLALKEDNADNSLKRFRRNEPAVSIIFPLIILFLFLLTWIQYIFFTFHYILEIFIIYFIPLHALLCVITAHFLILYFKIFI